MEGARYRRCPSSEAQGYQQGAPGHAPRQDLEGVREPLCGAGHQAPAERGVGPFVGVQCDRGCFRR